jgi:MFS family permease
LILYNAAVLVFPQFFSFGGQYQSGLPSISPTFFLSRPRFSSIYYGDKVGRKTTLVIALLTMGISTVPGFLPSYASIGIALYYCYVAFGQGLGGEWVECVIIENAPPNKRALVPQLGANFVIGGLS